MKNQKRLDVIDEHCETCRFYVAGVIDERLGVCRRHAPSPLIGSAPVRNTKRKLALMFRPACWPLTEPNDWCGEYRLKDQEA